MGQGLETVQQGSQDIYGGFQDSFANGLALQKQSIVDINKAAADIISSYQFTNTQIIAVSIFLLSLTVANLSAIELLCRGSPDRHAEIPRLTARRTRPG